MKIEKINMRDIVAFCNRYNGIGYGSAKIIETGGRYVVELYNAGFSENESVDLEFEEKYKRWIIYNRHPITIAEFKKRSPFSELVSCDDIKMLTDCYEHREEYTFEILL